MQSNHPTHLASPGPYRTALVLDDDPISLHLAQSALQDLGIANVATAEDGMAGIRLLDRMGQKPDLIICDLYMPEMDGIEVLNKLGERNYAGGVILATAGDLTIMEIAAKMAQSSNTLHLLGAFAKPLTPAVIAGALGLAPPC